MYLFRSFAAMWDSALKYRLYCVIKANVSYPNSKRELVFNIKEGKQTSKHSENPHLGADGSRYSERRCGQGAEGCSPLGLTNPNKAGLKHRVL